MGRGFTLVGQMAPFYIFPCGHAFHAQCLIAHVTRCTVDSQVNTMPLSRYCHLIATTSHYGTWKFVFSD